MVLRHIGREGYKRICHLLPFDKGSIKAPLCLKYRQCFYQGLAMQSKPIFPSLQRNVSIAELRKEIRRRMEIAARLGLIRKPKK